MLYILLTMYEVHLYAKLLVQMLSHMLGSIDRTMLATCAAKADRKIGKTSLYVTLHAGIYQGIDMIQESEYLAIFLEELDDWFIESDKRFVAIILARVVDSAAVEHEAATITCGIIGDAFLIGKAHHPHLEVLLRLRELFELREFREYLAEIRIFAERLLEQLAEIIYPELAKYLEIIVGVADISLLTYNPGLTFVRFLEYLKENDYADTLNGKGYLDKIEDCDNLYKIGYEFTRFSIEKLTKVQEYVYNEIAEYFKMPIAVELNDWVSRVWEKAKQLRKIAPHYILDVILGYWGDVRNNKVFCSIYLGLGTPLVINADDEGTIVPPEGFKPSENFMPGLYWAIDEIRRIFGGDSCAKECLLKGYCSWSSTQEGSNIIVNERCDTAPWLRAKEDMDFCPVGAIWRHWGLTEHTPRFKDDA